MARFLDDPVEITLRQWAAERMRYGQSDCALSVFQYLDEALGISGPLRNWIGQYTDRDGAQAIMREQGGPIALFQKEMRNAGLKRQNDPRRGDVGIVRNEGQVLSGLCVSSNRWAVRAESGFAVFRPSWVVAYGAR